MRRVLKELESRLNLKWVLPSTALESQNEAADKTPKQLTSAAHPIPVKKQAKYNINRWSVAGRDNLWLNTVCHKICRSLLTSNNENPDSWRELCEFWASDLRTHITAQRWSEVLLRLQPYLNRFSKHKSIASVSKSISLPQIHNLEGVSIEMDTEEIFWTFRTKTIQLVLNARRGLTIKSLAFASHNFEPFLGTLSQGYFDSIELGADYYCGGVLIEFIEERLRVTDLEWAHPDFTLGKDSLEIRGSLALAKGHLHKTININLKSELITLRYDFDGFERPLGIVRVGGLTILPEHLHLPLKYACHLGGRQLEHFTINSSVNHTQPASQFVSSTSAAGGTEGLFLLTDSTERGIQIKWDPAECAASPMLKHLRIHESHLTRLFFSLSELDDTSKKGGKLLPLSLMISPYTPSDSLLGRKV
jgi:hypothetical protein